MVRLMILIFSLVLYVNGEAFASIKQDPVPDLFVTKPSEVSVLIIACPTADLTQTYFETVVQEGLDFAEIYFSQILDFLECGLYRVAVPAQQLETCLLRADEYCMLPDVPVRGGNLMSGAIVGE